MLVYTILIRDLMIIKLFFFLSSQILGGQSVSLDYLR